MSRSALAGCRGLARCGWQVTVGAPARGLAPASRSVRGWHSVPAPERGLDAFLAGLREAIEEGGHDVVFPSEDSQVLALSQVRSEIPAVVPYPSHELVLGALDKLGLVRAGERAGLAVPRTVPATSQAMEGWGGPAVVKARWHGNLGRPDAPTHFEPAVLAGGEARARVEWIRGFGGEPLLQEPVHGSLMAFTAVADRGSGIVAAVQQESQRIWPPGAGISTRARTVETDPELERRVARLLADLGWFGLAELQFIRTGDGPPRLVDLNPRYYGSLALAVGAGVNLPGVWAALAVGEDPPAVRVRVGRRYQWLEGDLRRALVERRGGALRDVLASLAAAIGAVHSVWSARDPGPALRYVAVLVGRAARKAVRWRSSSSSSSA